MWQNKAKNNTKSILYAINDVKGITLIALIITIVVLLILAGITVASLTGGDGTMEKAQQAKDKTALSQKIEEVENAIALSTSNAFNEDVDMNKLQTNLGNITGVTLSTEVFPAKVEILDEPYIIYSDGELFKGSTGNTRVPIPDGFVASQASGENDVNTGLVIYEGDDPVTDSNVATARRERDQFVWVPVGGNIKYERDTTISNSYQSNYNAYSDWTDPEGAENVKSVTKYGGFYIGRYEAGWAQKENGDTYETDKTTVSKNDTSRTPVCRKGYAGWNWISQAKSKIVCENMYKNSESVKSQLIDSYAWDTAVNWFNKTRDCRAYNKITNSVTYGNYTNNTSSIPANTLYAIPIDSNTWLNPISYRKSNTAVDTSYRSKTISASDLGNYTNETSGTSFSSRLELSTGASDDYSLNNVYDMAGNFWEWTTEVGKRNSTSASATVYAVLRGGSFNNAGGLGPVVYRNGNNSTSFTNLGIGFRPVLYLK